MNLSNTSMHQPGNHKFIGNSPEAKRINRAIKKFAKVDSNVLLVGETGVGKEYIAEKIHLLSRRKNRSFVSVNCSALGYTIGKKELFGEETEVSYFFVRDE